VVVIAGWVSGREQCDGVGTASLWQGGHGGESYPCRPLVDGTTQRGHARKTWWDGGYKMFWSAPT